jgi:hypothetical protein
MDLVPLSQLNRRYHFNLKFNLIMSSVERTSNRLRRKLVRMYLSTLPLIRLDLRRLHHAAARTLAGVRHVLLGQASISCR